MDLKAHSNSNPLPATGRAAPHCDEDAHSPTQSSLVHTIERDKVPKELTRENSVGYPSFWQGKTYS